MPTVKQYVTGLRNAQQQIALKFGSGLSDKRSRVLILSVLAPVAVIVKLLVDKGYLTDAELQTAMNNARDDLYDEEPDDGLPAP